MSNVANKQSHNSLEAASHDIPNPMVNLQKIDLKKQKKKVFFSCWVIS